MKNAQARWVLLSSLLAAATMVACGSGGKADIRKDGAGTNGAPGSGDGTTTPGSRIIALSYEGSDGSKTFAGLFDKQLQKPCAFERLGSTNVCVPPDVFTVSAEVFYDSYKTASPALYTDPKCGEPNVIALPEDEALGGCSAYGVIRISGSKYASDTPGCGWGNYGSGLAVVTPVPATTKIYAWGQGGGQCCSCAEWVPPSYGSYRAYAVQMNPDDAALASVKLVTAKLDVPTAQ